MTWLTDNLGTIMVSLVLAAIVTGLIVSMVKNRKKGISSCGCNCSTCPSGCHCQKSSNKTS